MDIRPHDPADVHIEHIGLSQGLHQADDHPCCIMWESSKLLKSRTKGAGETDIMET